MHATGQHIRFLLAEGSDFPLEQRNLPPELRTQALETLKVFESAPNEFELERLRKTLNDASKLNQAQLLLIFTSKRAVHAVTSNLDMQRIVIILGCKLASVGKETNLLLEQTFCEASDQLLQPAPIQGLKACIEAHSHAYSDILIIGTQGGVSETIVSEMIKLDQKRTYNLFCVYKTKKSDRLADTIAEKCRLEQDADTRTPANVSIFCCTSATAVKHLAECILANERLQKTLGTALFFLPLGPSAQEAVKLNALPTWHLSCKDV